MAIVRGDEVTLLLGEMLATKRVGVRRNRDDIAYGFNPGGGFVSVGSTGDEQNVLGTRGECAVSAWLGRPWNPAGMKRPDVAPYEVRATFKAYGDLKIRERDKDGSVFILVNKISSVRFLVRGWMEAGEAKRVGQLKNPKVGAKLGPAWFVSLRALHPMNKLPKVVTCR